ncbi:MAG TPA: ATP-dependent zinc metalloprotease FtsH [Candidatus Dormibacteraeota bacterium]|nr:ATP-dependent zinc metalloprotease FtsH [Candidatus Dormibacteraeota bacterium]
MSAAPPRWGKQPGSGPSPPGSPPTGPPRRPPLWRSWKWWIFLGALLLANILIANFAPGAGGTHRVTIPYSTFKQQVDKGNVVSVTSTAESIDGHAKKAVSAPGSSDSSVDFHTERPAFAGGPNGDNLEKILEDAHVQVTANPPTTSTFLILLESFGPTLLFAGLFLLIIRRSASAAGGGVFGLGKSQARLYDPERPRTTFKDVAGIEEAKQELEEVVDFLREPQKYQRLGGTIPKGVLLVGAPGTGKTLLARAVAGEAGVAFMSISASEFVEMIVGVGAARVRDLFAKARAAAPAIVFIDELDAIGRSRASGMRLGGTDEQEQTLNQILTEMDGFDSREGVIVLAATNRADVLDAALLRPGRFDRRVLVQPPDRAGRAAILRIHTREVPLAPDVDLDDLAQQTTGLVGAELRNLVNEAALLAARLDHDAVTRSDFSQALEKNILGAARHIVLTPKDRERTAVHESGHALLALLIPGTDPVRKVSIVPRGMALGVTVQSPVDDRQNYPEDYLRARITVALGGRAAEQVVYGLVTTGAENDLLQVTRIAHQMVARFGMSERVGPLNFGTDDEGARPFGTPRPYSEATAEVIDSEVRSIVDGCFDQACGLLTEHRWRLDELTRALIAEDSIDEDDILRVAGMRRDGDGNVEITATSPPARAATG